MSHKIASEILEKNIRILEENKTILEENTKVLKNNAELIKSLPEISEEPSKLIVDNSIASKSTLSVNYETVDYKKDLKELIQSFEMKFIEREELIRIALLFLFSEKNLFLIGQPGVGKTFFCQRFFSLVTDATFWEIQFSKGTTEKDLFNAEFDSDFSIVNAEYVYLDEMYKATAQLLNKLLSYLNEGYITIGGRTIPVKKRVVFGASNELDTSEEAKAFTDRFIGTVEVRRIVSRDNKIKLIEKKFDQSKNFPRYFKLDEMDYVVKKSKEVSLTDEIKQLYATLMDRTDAEGLKCSDRKFGNALDVLKTSAFLNNRDRVDFSDIFIMKDIAWADYNERTNVKRILFELMFGNKVDIEDKLKNLEIDVTTITSTKDSDFSHVLNYEYEFQGKEKELIFDNAKECISTIVINYNMKLDILSEIVDRYEKVMKIEEEINSNIFLTNVRNKVFTNQVVEEMERLYGIIDLNKKQCDEWLISNRVLYSYEERYFDKK